MSTTTFAGIFSMGFVFGYLLYYAVRHTKEFNIDLLSSAIGAVGGGVVVALFGKTDGWVGPYGIGLLVGFAFYLVLSLILILKGRFQEVANKNVLLLSKTLLGAPREEYSTSSTTRLFSRTDFKEAPMSQDTADIVGTTGASFTMTVSSGTVTSAFLQVAGKPNVALTVDGTGRGVLVPNLPKGQSFVRLDIVWGPADPDAIIDVGTVASGTVKPADPKHTLDAGKTPGFVEQFGK